MKVRELIQPSSTDTGATEMSFIPNMYKRKNAGRKKNVRKEKITVRDTATGKVYGRRVIQQKAT